MAKSLSCYKLIFPYTFCSDQKLTNPFTCGVNYFFVVWCYNLSNTWVTNKHIIWLKLVYPCLQFLECLFNFENFIHLQNEISAYVTSFPPMTPPSSFFNIPCLLWFSKPLNPVSFDHLGVGVQLSKWLLKAYRWLVTEKWKDACAFNSRTWEEEAGRSQCVQGHPCLQREF